ncbi:MAG TPA: TonB-dependent receptor [Burkholderiales bacterium]|nr:TonB-dependent receptor [Burkholderiales bacterium]
MSRVAAAVGLAFVAGAAVADPSAAELTELPIEQLLRMQVFGASKFQQDTREAPAAVSVMTREDIRTFGYRTLGEALDGMRGVFVTGDRNYSYLGIRGFARPGDYNTRALMLVDGYRVNDNVYNTAPIGREFPVDLSLVERIEFIPGPGSSLYGSNAFLGVINVVTRKAEDVGAEASAYAASGSASGLRLNLGKRFEDGPAVLVSAARERAGGEDLYFPEFAAVNGGFARGLDFERAERAYARVEQGPFTLSAGGSSRVKGIPTASFGAAFGVPGSQSRDSYGFADIRYQSALAERTDLLLRFNYQDYRYRGSYMYDVPPLTENRDEVRGTHWGAEARVSHRISERHRFIAGIEYQDDVRIDQVNFDASPFALYQEDRRSAKNHAFYAESEYRLNPDLLLNAGIRHDAYGSGFSSTNPRLALVQQLDRGRTVKLLYGTAFRAPNAYERYYDLPGGDQKANPSLGPERIRTYEAVYEQVMGRTRLAGSAYLYRIDGLIDLVVDPLDGRRQFVNAGEVRTRGVEAEAEHRFVSGLRLRGSAGLQLARSGDAWLDSSPKRIVKAQASIPLAGERTRLGLEARHLGARAVRGSEVPSYTVLNATLSTPIAPNAQIRASAYNLADRAYWDPGSEEHVQDRLQRDGRAFFLELDVRF